MLSTTELKFMHIIWKNEPINSSELVKICEKEFGWKKSTTYTFIKRLEKKNVLENKLTIVKSIKTKSEILKCESNKIIEDRFKGSFVHFVSAFLSDNNISVNELEEIKKIISDYEESLK